MAAATHKFGPKSQLEIERGKGHFGPGYRVYFAAHGGRIILLLNGSDKATQNKDIKKATQCWEVYLKNNQ